MASGSHKDLLKVVTAFVSSSNPTHPVPEDLQSTVNAYFERHPAREEYDAQRLQADLLDVYHKNVAAEPDRHAAFLVVLRLLRPAILGTDRLLEWWDLLVRPTLNSVRLEKAVLADANAILLSILLYDPDDDRNGEAAKASEMFTTRLLDTYMEKSSMKGDGQFADDVRFRFVTNHLESVLVSFGKKRSKALLVAIDRYLVDPRRRLQALSLLCSFLRHQPPHLHQVLNTPLFDHLLKCLMNDTSTTVITLAITNLVMLLPHIPNSLVAYLPRLFMIYARLLCWDKISNSQDEPSKEELMLGSPASVMTVVVRDPTWESLDQSSDAVGSQSPEVDHFFTHLYGLYPINFMAFVREPNKYLQSSPWAPAECELDEVLILERTEPYRQIHLLHPNFYSMTIESELTDVNRWKESEPADILAQCLGLCAIVNARLGGPGPPPTDRLPDIPEALIPTEEIPDQSLLSSEEDGILSESEDSAGRSSWRNTQSTAVSTVVIRPEMPNLARKSSQLSLGQRSKPTSTFPSPIIISRENSNDSPTLPPQYASPTDSKAQDLLMAHDSLRLGVHQSLANDSVHSFQTAHTAETNSPRVDAYIHSLAATTAAKSPAFRAHSNDPHATIAHLQQQVVLLKNNLNFERYLKQQQSVHIGQLQKKHIGEATIEAETQNLRSINQTLKMKLERANKSYGALKTESEKTKTNAKKTQEDLNAKLKTLREDQKQWTMDEEAVYAQLRNAKAECEQLRKLLVDAERKELASRQKMQSISQDLEELDRLKLQVEALVARLREYEQKEHDFTRSESRYADMQAVAEQARLRLRARDGEKDRMRKVFDVRIAELESKLQVASSNHHPLSTQPPAAFQAMLDSALAASRSRLAIARKAHQQLLERYQGLEMQYLELRAERELRKDSMHMIGDRDSMDTDEINPLEMDDASIDYRGASRKDSFYVPHSLSGTTPYASRTLNSPPQQFRSPLITSPTSYYNSASNREKMQQAEGSIVMSAEGSESSEGNPGPGSASNSANGGMPPMANGGISVGRSTTAPIRISKPKIQPTSEVRMRGRGGVQNIGKKEKEKRDRRMGGGIVSMVGPSMSGQGGNGPPEDGNPGGPSAPGSGGSKPTAKTGLRALIG